MLEKSNTTLEITDWLIYFANTILKAQENTLKRIDYLIEKTKFFDRYSSQLNERQFKVIKRLFEAGFDGFKGGLSANNYQTIARASASTTTRDLQDFPEEPGTIQDLRPHTPNQPPETELSKDL